MYNIRRSSASGVYYGERVYSGSTDDCMDWIFEMLLKRSKDGWEYSWIENTIELTHDDRADVIWFNIERQG